MSIALSLRRRLSFWFFLILGTLGLIAGTLAFVGYRNLFEPANFGQRAEESLSDPGVAAYTADLLTQSLVQSRPDLIAFRPILRATADSIVTTRPFRAVVGTAARRAHEAAFSEGARRVLLSLPDFEVLLREALRQASPALADKIPKRLESVASSLANANRIEVLVEIWRAGRRLAWIWKVLLFLAPVCLLLALWRSHYRRRAVVRIGFAVGVAGLILSTLPVIASLSTHVISNLSERALAKGLLWSYFRDLQDWGFFYIGLGVLIAAGGASLLEAIDPIASLENAARLFAVPPTTVGLRALWATTLLLGGLLLVTHPRESLSGAVILAGAAASFVGVRELFRLLLDRLAHVPPTAEPDARNPYWILAGSVAFLLVLGLAGIWVWFRNPSVQPITAPELSCNGNARLCDLRLNEIVFAGAHNAMSNQEIPGWMFPHHEASIPHQLEAGIRALLIDIHYGFPGAARIKTDMSTEPMADKVKAAVGEEGYEAALRIRDRLVGVDEGRRGLYFCHGVCELGAYEVEPVLRDIRSFLIAHPDEVVIAIIEDYVSPTDLAAAFDRAELTPLVYKGQPGPPWPTLRELIHQGQRLVVFTESGKPGVEWLRPAFQSFRETPYSFHTLPEFSCAANRGGNSGSLFLLNNWVETTPTPKPSNAAIVNAFDFLLDRATQCAQERTHIPNIIAVDFFRTGDLLRVVDRLNAVDQPPAPVNPFSP